MIDAVSTSAIGLLRKDPPGRGAALAFDSLQSSAIGFVAEDIVAGETEARIDLCIYCVDSRNYCIYIQDKRDYCIL